MQTTLYSLFLAFLATTFLLGGCGLTGNGERKTAQTDSTFISATLNEEGTWTAKEVNGNLSKLVGFEWINISGVRTRGRYRETLSFSVIFDGLETYLLLEDRYEEGFDTQYAGSSFYESEMDVSVASYSPTDDSLTNQLTITSYDSTTGIMEGTFRTTVVVDSAERVSEPGEPPRRQPDTLRFTNGEFRVKVEDRRDE